LLESTLLSADPYQIGSEPLSITKDKPPRFPTTFLFWQKLGLFFVKYLRFFAALDKKQFR
jgi:hypothetical protein